MLCKHSVLVRVEMDALGTCRLFNNHTAWLKTPLTNAYLIMQSCHIKYTYIFT